MGGCVSAVRMSGQPEWRYSPMGLNERMRAYTPPPDHLLKNTGHILALALAQWSNLYF